MDIYAFHVGGAHSWSGFSSREMEGNVFSIVVSTRSRSRNRSRVVFVVWAEEMGAG